MSEEILDQEVETKDDEVVETPEVDTQEERFDSTVVQHRATSADASPINEETRTVKIAISSEEPYERYFGNEVLGHIIGNVRGSVEKGQSLSEPLKISEEFPPDTVQMISVGEETGNLDGMLNKVADFYDMSIGYTIKKLTTILEPLFLVIMGGMVGFIMASLLLPIFDMIKILRR